mgnify:CR=1 FL=1
MRDTYLDQIRSTPDMKEMSVSTTVHPVEHQLGSGFFKREKNMMDVLAGHKNPFHGGKIQLVLRDFPKIGDLDKDLLRGLRGGTEAHGGTFFGDVLKGLSFLPIPFISDVARTLTLTGAVK